MTWPWRRREDGKLRSDLVAGQKLVDLFVVDVPLPEPLPGVAFHFLIAGAPRPPQIFQRHHQFAVVAHVEPGELISGHDLLSGVIGELLDDPSLLPRGEVGQRRLVEFHRAECGDRPGQTVVVNGRRLHASQHDAVGRQLNAADRTRRQRLRFARAALALGEVHVADRALLLVVVAHDGRVHRAEVFVVRTDRCLVAVQGTGPFFVVVVEVVPEADDAADGDQDDHETQPGLDDLDDRNADVALGHGWSLPAKKGMPSRPSLRRAIGDSDPGTLRGVRLK